MKNLKPVAKKMTELFQWELIRILGITISISNSLDNNISTTDYTVQTPFVNCTISWIPIHILVLEC